jgi:NADH-quinone oxidoreductase subunit M
MRHLGWLLLGVVLVPFGGAWLAATRRGSREAQWAGGFVTLAVLLLSVGLWAGYHLSGLDGFLEAPLRLPGGLALFGVDHLSAVLLPFVALLAAAAVLGGPRAELSPGAVGRLLAAEGAYLGLFLSLDLRLFALFWVGALAPIFLELRAHPDPSVRRRTTRFFVLFPVLGSLPLLGALLLMHRGGLQEGLAHPFAVQELLRRGLPQGIESLTFGLLWASILMRVGVAPLHSWLPELFERGSLWVALMMGALKPGLFLLLRLSWRLLPHASERWLGALMVLGLATTLYGALLGLGQRTLRGLVGALAVSHSGLILAGLCSGTAEGKAGGLTQWLAIGASMAGLSVAVWSLEARLGSSRVDDLGGIVNRAPALSFCFLFFGLAALGLPGTLTFLGEDLLLHGLLASHPASPVALAAALALNAASVFRAYSRAFLGKPRSLFEVEDLSRRERLAAAGLAVLLVMGGLIPGTLVKEESRVIDRSLTLGGSTENLAHR